MAMIKMSDFTPIRIRSLYEARTSLLLQGSPGIGKSTIIREWPAKLSALYGEEFGYHEITPANQESAELRGFLIPTKDKDGRAVATYTYPSIFPSREYLAKHPRGILNIEELDQCPHDTAKVLASVILSNRIGDFCLPEGWWVVCSSNRTSDRSGAVRQLMHIVNRQRRIEVSNDVEGLCAWMEGQGIHPMFIAFTRARPSVVFTNTVPDQPQPFCTPRSLVSAARYMQQVVGANSMDFRVSDFDQLMVAGDIGTGASAELFGFAEVRDHIPSLEDILHNPEKAKMPTLDRMDALFAVTELALSGLGEDTADAVLTYLMRLPRQLQVSAMGRAVSRHARMLASSKVFRSWITKPENQSLVHKSLS